MPSPRPEPGPAAEAAAIIRDVLAAVDDGVIEASGRTRDYLAGAAYALEVSASPPQAAER